ncbi:copper homeostasis protein (lipoprotein) [Flavobacterium sp. 270]|uniref:copper resistance protein NlpE n=1 Tax=Flavobacterium sp. 270 TaxID=2512114 RepID=UPI001064ABB6|nr:copper resistance protein NlpE N-terminal domain-containing protein [Flavobacterium sp. 270]TDW47373.1 copper homeostasis protein (lipoprotein) [Flavobacterium sp. 270]
MKKTIYFAAIMCLLLSCNSKKTDNNTLPENEKPVSKTNNDFRKTTIYEGLLPCADCTGINTTLKINTDYGVMQNNKFELISTYQGKEPGNTFTQKGNFNTERGLENDPDGTIYVLNWDQPLEKQIYYGYYSANPEKIYLLDKDRKIIKSKLNYFLLLKK